MKRKVVSAHVKATLRETLKNTDNIMPIACILSGDLINNIDLTMYGMLCDTKDDFITSVKENSTSNQCYYLENLNDLVDKMSQPAKEAGFKIADLRTFSNQQMNVKELKSNVVDILSKLDQITISELVNFIKAVILFEES